MKKEAIHTEERATATPGGVAATELCVIATILGACATDLCAYSMKAGVITRIHGANAIKLCACAPPLDESAMGRGAFAMPRKTLKIFQNKSELKKDNKN